MVTPCKACQDRKKERKLWRELKKLKKDNKQSEEANEKIRLEIAMLQNNCEVLDEYCEAKARARGDGYSHGDGDEGPGDSGGGGRVEVGAPQDEPLDLSLRKKTAR